jgi:serine/threonine protein kinase
VEGFERLLAVKRILDSIAEDEVFIKMFIDEAKIAGQLNHPNIAQIFDLGRVDGSYFIALEYVSGKDLRTLWERMVSLGEHGDVFMACHMVMKVCEALQYAHDKRDAAGNELNIVHRDISPQNILISYEGDVKIIDFGIAKAQGKSSQTQVGILKGKFSYMSPEQVRGLHVDHRADIFSLGIVLYELLTVTRLFLGESDFDTLEKIRKVEMSPPTLYNPHIPRELEDIVLKSLAKSPDERYQSGSELHDALEQFLRNQSSYYGTKDLATYMKGAFVAEIELERKKLDYYRTINIESLGGDIQGDSSSTPVDIWDEDTSLFGRGRNFNEISPAAEMQLADTGYAGSGAESSEMRMTAGAPDLFPSALAKMPGVDLNKPIDNEDDPTMEWDRFNLEELSASGLQLSPGPEVEPEAPVTQAPPVEEFRPATPPRQASDPLPSIVPPVANSRSSAGLILALLFFIGTLVLGGTMAVVFAPKFMEAKKADLKFKISGADSVDIVIDGKIVHGGPTKDGYVLVENPEPGKREITIKAAGRDEVSDSLMVEAGKSYEIPVELKETPKAVSVAGVKVKLNLD